MFNICNKKFHTNKFLNLVQRFFCRIKIYRQRSHKKVMNHLHTKKHYRLTYIHVFLLFIIFYLYGITTFNRGDDINVPPSDAPIVIENEPQIIPDQSQEEIILTDEGEHSSPID